MAQGDGDDENDGYDEDDDYGGDDEHRTVPIGCHGMRWSFCPYYSLLMNFGSIKELQFCPGINSLPFPVLR